MDETTTVDCPHCGAANELLVEPMRRRQRFMEDCHVCSGTIDLRMKIDDGSLVALAA